MKLITYLKPFGWTIALIFLLLFGQAMCDLALPDYMSRIVNVGIQQNGIEDAAPRAIRAGEMERLFLFMAPSTREDVSRYYLLLDREELSPEMYQRYLAAYPALAEGPVYILDDVSGTETQRLSTIFGPPAMLVDNIEKNGVAALPGMPDLPPGMDFFTWLAGLPPEMQEQVRQAALQTVSRLPESFVKQSAITYLAAEYEAVGINLSRIQSSFILKIGGFMLGLTLLATALSVWVGFLSARTAARFARNTRKRIFDRVESFSNTEFDKFSTASLITRTTNDVQQIQMVMVILMRIVFYAPIIGIGAAIRALGQDMSMSWIIGAAVAVLLTMVVVVFIVAVPRFKIIQKLVDRLNLVTREMLTGLMVIRAFNTQDHEMKKFDAANRDVTSLNLFVNRIMVFMMPAMMLLMNGVMLLIIWYGARQVDAGLMQVGSMMAFMQYTMLVIMAFLMVSMIFIMLPRAIVSAQRISEVLDTAPVITDPPNPRTFNGDLRGQVTFENVSFKYPGADEYVLKDISFTARPGQTTAIVGGTGSGKSTLVNLIPRFYDVTAGRVLVNGLDIRETTQHALREKIGYVPQKSILFSGTIESNLRYADEQAPDELLEKVAAAAQSLDFIRESENGFKTAVSQDGSNFSGGQKQRLAIARALARRPEIFIFDDSFSAIDYRTDVALRKALKQEAAGATVIIVAQRISTIRHADQIIVLENGRITGQGTHQELMDSCRFYRELALSQLSKEDLI